jgi:NIL domain
MLVTQLESPTLLHSRIRVPQQYYHQPVVSRLISRYGLGVNITAAFLPADCSQDGWFDLQLRGYLQQLDSSVAYLLSLGIEVVQLNLAHDIHSGQVSPPFPIPTVSFARTEVESIPPTASAREVEQWMIPSHSNRVRLQLCISTIFHPHPVISDLVSLYGLTVNITSALLNLEALNDGWFDLELWGNSKQLQAGLNFLKQLGLSLWLEPQDSYL